MTSPYSTGYDTDNTSSGITVSHHHEDLIVISSNLPPGTTLTTNQLEHKPVKCMGSVFATHHRHMVCKKALKMHQYVQHMAQL